MTFTKAQGAALAHVRSAYFGPSEGESEILFNRPHLQYSVGMLFPAESEVSTAQAGGETDALGMGVEQGDVEEDGAGVPLAEDWRPSSVAISFVTDSSPVLARISGATYASIPESGPPRWQRLGFCFEKLELGQGKPPQEIKTGDLVFEVGSRWRKAGHNNLVTVHVRLLTKSTLDDKLDIPLMIFQTALEVRTQDGAQFLEYDLSSALDIDEESAELRLRYRSRKVFAVGHGMAADWELDSGRCVKVSLTPVPAFVVPTVETAGFESGSDEGQALKLSELARIDSEPEGVLKGLDAFVRAFSVWVDGQKDRTESFSVVADVANRIVARSEAAASRMEAGVALLRDPKSEKLRQAFSLGMAAMRLQMIQARHKNQQVIQEPKWRPFQLGFLLIALSSTVENKHEDRELVDLIWFPTGGGKTEAYLGLAAIEIFRRRLVRGVEGGGTAVITRYTLRLLTAQQFQRAASLVCAMEVLRGSDARAKGMAPFSIGLWVGNEATPGTRAMAKGALERLHKAARPEEANQFQIESCPWCNAPLVPGAQTTERSRYGFKLVGKDLVIHCTDADCRFRSELPLSVVDEALYEQPPTILLATVDKFARLQFKEQSGRLLGLNTVYDQPSMIIQDELHLLSGPLGTTVSVFDAVIQQLLSKNGSIPKIIASTATIRASDEQVKGLYGRKVALYPPSGLDDDKTFFSHPVGSGEGRMYVGLMPQSTSHASSLVSAAAPLVELPTVLAAATAPDGKRDAYWTLVIYHNSLRELGRSGTLVVDDVNGRLETRAERLGLELRRVRADRVLELTSRRGPDELPNDLRQLGVSANHSDGAVDVVLSSNMLSVGIDIPRLALMLMVGQPKTTAEYIQATSRVGRGDNNGIVVTLFRSNRARDRSHFETFRGYHEALYRSVEPTSVTPWSIASRERTLAGALVALVRQSFQMFSADSAAGLLNLDDDVTRDAIDRLVTKLLSYVGRSDEVEEPDARDDLWRLLREWDLRAANARKSGEVLRYERRDNTTAALLKRFGQAGEGWLVGDSMRSVEPNVSVEVQEPNDASEEATTFAENQT